MAWSTRNNSTIPEAALPWSNVELENWSTEYLHLKQPEALFIPPSSGLSITTRMPTARPLPHNYQLQLPSTQFPSTPVAFGTMLSPTPSSSYLDTGTIKQPINNYSPRSIPAPAIGIVPALSPASNYDAGCPSPWDDLPVSTPIIQETLESDEASKELSRTKRTYRSRRRGSKIKDRDSESYGTFKCEWKDCQYDRLFSRKGVLMRHIETQHVNPRAFKCPNPRCNHASSRRENLKAHRQSVHKEIL
ncbi:hypothetical protein N7517_004578 [Penicillium concentricum]|uniref:C2H2-type domain-containing protein n=1 Tax=Penicillium concentricum TaxID=293559 RepID=A0A9W9S6J2_9EURO|nr:uncharacterized protein N7517_004578 [Penicillium concentricum]KAJ5372572.1 hypothetical protein N7517_004578 [Penicillium concentricum]